MSIRTGGPVRGWVSRWLVRFEASQQIFQLVFLGVTAVSTLTTALQAIGAGWLAPYVLGVGIIGSPLFAYGYVESGIFNRKNRERSDRGNNFAGPSTFITTSIQAQAFGAALRAEQEGDDPERAAYEAVEQAFTAYRNGVDVHEVGNPDVDAQQSNDP